MKVRTTRCHRCGALLSGASTCARCKAIIKEEQKEVRREERLAKRLGFSCRAYWEAVGSPQTEEQAAEYRAAQEWFDAALRAGR